MSLDLGVADIVDRVLQARLPAMLDEALARLNAASLVGGLMPVKAAAKRAGVSTGLLRKFRREGKLRKYRAGRRVLVKWEELEALLAEPTVNGGELATVDSIMARIDKRKAG